MASSENTKKISPAIHIDETQNEMTEDEFQRTLIKWFEDRGLLSELRAHLRKQMIGMLKDTSIGQTTTKISTKLSPKDHVTNLLVAEFLLKNRYHYSLSVFSTEVPYFMNLLPDFSKVIPTVNTLNIKNFNHENFKDILETLGFTPESYESEKLYDLYFNNNNLSLLNCMINLLPKITKLKIINNENEDPIGLEPWLKDIHNLLLHYEIKSEFLTNLRNQIKVIFERELIQIRNEEQIKYQNKQKEINSDIECRELEIKKIITEMESTYNKERKKLSDEHMKELKNVEKLKIQYKQYKNDLESKLELLQKRENLVKQRELELEDQIKVLKSRTNIMQNVFESMIDESKKITQFREEIRFENPEETIKNLNNECTQLREELKNAKQNIEKIKMTRLHKGTQTNPTTDNSEHQLLKQMLERTKNENASLRTLNNEQQRRLNEITTQNASLINDLENSQSTISVLTRQNSLRGTITVPPIMPSAPFSRSNYRSSNLTGGGENLGYVPTSPPVFRRMNQNYRRRKHCKLPSKDNSSSSSPTEDILVEARERLRRLERESENIDRHYRTFRERQNRENLTTFGTLSINNIPETIRAQQSDNREALFSTLRPTFHSRICDLPSSSNRVFHFSANNINSESKPGTSFNRKKKNDDNSSSVISHLENLSISSIELSDSDQASNKITKD